MKLVKHSLLLGHSSKLQAIKLQKVYPSARWIDLFSCRWGTRQRVDALLFGHETVAGSPCPWAENTRNHRACSPVFTENGWNHRVFSPVFDKNMRNHRVVSLVFMKNDWEPGASRLFLKKNSWEPGVFRSFLIKTVENPGVFRIFLKGMAEPPGGVSTVFIHEGTMKPVGMRLTSKRKAKCVGVKK